MDTSTLIDSVYEAGLVPDRWPSVLTALDQMFDGVGTGLFVANTGHLRWTCSPYFEEHMLAFFREGWSENNVRPHRAITRRLIGFVTERDLFEPDELKRDPLFQDFMLPRGLGGELGTIISVPTGDTLVLSINRPFKLGTASAQMVARANSLRPHLARAALFSARLRLERARAAADALRSVGIPTAVLAGAGRVLAANELLQDIMPNVVVDRPTRIAFVDRSADDLLKVALERLSHDSLSGGVNSIPIKASERNGAYIAHLLPVCRVANDLFSRADLILIVTPVDKKAVPGAKLLEGLFDLTPAEARIARAVSDGRKTLETIAGECHVSRETVRTQLKSVLLKTGVSRLAELVALLNTVNVL